MMRSSAACVLLCAALLTGSCAEPAAETSSDFSYFAESYFNRYFDFNPSEATSAGLHHYDNRLEERSSARIQSRVGELQAQATELAEIRKGKLSESDRIDATILANRINAELLDLNTIRVWRSPLYYAGIPGNAVDLLMKRNFETPQVRLDRVTSRLKQIPALLEAMRDNTREPPREFTDLALRLLKGSIPFFRDTVPEWAKTAAGGNEKQLAEFNLANRKATAALEVITKHLETNLIRLSTGNYSIGPDNFRKKLQYEEMVEVPLDKLLAIGEERLEKDHQAFLEVARQVAPGRSPTDAVEALEVDSPGEGNLLTFAASTLESARKFVVDRSIIPIPSEERAKIEATPPYARSGSFASMDTPGAFETNAREAFYYVTPPEKDWTAAHKAEHLKLYNRPVMDIITVHEAYPGHYVQFLYVKQFPTKTRKLVSCGTNVEGWAHYAEQMMVEQGFGGGSPKVRLAQLAEALVRDARYVAGIKLHTAGWTVEDATKLFVDKAFMKRANAFEEARRGTYNPTYLYYTLGKLQIYKLRGDYQRSKGSDYSVAKFHEEFVKQGGIPVPLIRQILLPGNQESTL